MNDKIVIVGGGGHAKVIVNTIKKLSTYEILGYTDSIDKGSLLGVKYLGDDSVLPEIINLHKNCNAVIAVGVVGVSSKRQDIYKSLKELGFNLPVLISKTAIIGEEVSIDEGTIILEDAVINVGSIIGKCVIVNNGVVIDHDCIIKNYAHLTPKTRISSGVTIGINSFIGSGAIITRNTQVLDKCLIGAGAVLYRNTIKEGKYLGIPALLTTDD